MAMIDTGVKLYLDSIASFVNGIHFTCLLIDGEEAVFMYKKEL